MDNTRKEATRIVVQSSLTLRKGDLVWVRATSEKGTPWRTATILLTSVDGKTIKTIRRNLRTRGRIIEHFFTREVHPFEEGDTYTALSARLYALAP